MLVGTFQWNVKFGDKDYNLQKVRKALEGKHVDLIVLPELFTTGILFTDKSQVHNLSEQVPEGYTCSILIEMAKEYKCHIVGSMLEEENGRYYNTCVLIGPLGFIGKQRKLHLPDYEKQYFNAGDKLEVFQMNDMKLGLLTCFDCWFPEASRILALKGAQIICHSANIISPNTFDITKVRAMENVLFFISSNRIGSESNGEMTWTFRGESRIIDPKGNIISQSSKEEQLSIVEIDPSLSVEKNNSDCSQLFDELKIYHTETTHGLR